MTQKLDSFPLGLGVIKRLLPHRPPFLMIDRVEGYSKTPRPSLGAIRGFTATEAFFEGHFPGLPLVPATLLIESLAQTAMLLQVIHGLQKDAEAAGQDPNAVTAALRNLDLGYRMAEGYSPNVQNEFLGAARTHFGLMTASNVKILKPVFPGDQVALEARLVREVSNVCHYEADAQCRGQLVAQGMLMLTRLDATLPEPIA
jgi:3-hydroxymyristoyl/3-hydroxydecanoyl-(acyl carrier protein) dehydratase